MLQNGQAFVTMVIQSSSQTKWRPILKSLPNLKPLSYLRKNLVCNEFIRLSQVVALNNHTSTIFNINQRNFRILNKFFRVYIFLLGRFFYKFSKRLLKIVRHRIIILLYCNISNINNVQGQPGKRETLNYFCIEMKVLRIAFRSPGDNLQFPFQKRRINLRRLYPSSELRFE